MDKWLPTIIQLVIVIVSAAGGWYLLRDQKGKLRADSEGVIVGTAKSLVGTLREELDRAKEQIAVLEAENKEDRAAAELDVVNFKAALKANQAETDFLRQELSVLKLKTDMELEKLRKLIAALRNGIKILTDQIRSLGHEPAWTDK